MPDNNNEDRDRKRIQGLIGIVLYFSLNFVVPYLGAQLINYVWNTIDDTKKELEH